jgi:Rrf2 family protein
MSALCFSKSIDYALVALAFLAERPERVWSARELARETELNDSLLAKILKQLQTGSVVRSVRGANGGYQVRADLHGVSILSLIELLEGVDGPANREPAAAPLAALKNRMRRFLGDVRVSDLVLPGHRIDVPVESVRFKTTKKEPAGLAPSA